MPTEIGCQCELILVAEFATVSRRSWCMAVINISKNPRWPISTYRHGLCSAYTISTPSPFRVIATVSDSKVPHYNLLHQLNQVDGVGHNDSEHFFALLGCGSIRCE